jgi:VanZ family protein
MSWGPPIVYMAAIFAISAQPNPLPELTTRVWDKLLHLAEYGGLAVLFVRALAREGAGWRDALLAAIVMTSLYGATDEFHQAFVPNRNSTVTDWVADSIGAIAGASISAAVYANVLRVRR